MKYNSEYPILFFFQDENKFNHKNEYKTIWEHDFLSLLNRDEVGVYWKLDYDPWIPLWNQYCDSIWG